MVPVTQIKRVLDRLVPPRILKSIHLIVTSEVLGGLLYCVM